ncbi:hypothetical protein D3C71_78240 [compost metagenome]
MNAQQRRLAKRSKQRSLRQLEDASLLGYQPDLTEWMANKDFVRKNMTVLFVEAPKFIPLSSLYRLAPREPLRIDN